MKFNTTFVDLDFYSGWYYYITLVIFVILSQVEYFTFQFLSEL